MQKAHLTEAIVIGCIDFRFQRVIENWIHANLGQMAYDRVSLAGGIFDFYTVLKQVEISHSLHKIQKVILLNHEDCGAYGELGTKERHIHDLVEAERKIETLYPDVEVDTYYIHLDGSFEFVSKTGHVDKLQ